VEVRVEAAPEGASITVRDSGPGVPAAIRARIFEPFFTTKDPDRGTGLGLPVCRGIARRHGGDVTVGDAPGGGAMFRVTLPAAETAEAEDARPDDIALRARGSRDDAAAPSRLRVLVVDDEEHVAALLRDTLEAGLGCATDTARSGAEAVRALSANEYQLVVCDVRMPGIDGPGVLEWIRECRPALAQRFLFVTGDAGTPRLAAHLARLGVPTLPKPFVPRTLLQRCELLLNA
jgi:CheY-like chemotaxis protein